MMVEALMKPGGLSWRPNLSGADLFIAKQHRMIP